MSIQLNQTQIEDLAFICHNVNRALCESHGDFTQKVWSAATAAHRESCRAGVRFLLQNPFALPSDQHDNWIACKRADGWVYGKKKDEKAKTHPCMVPYNELPPAQRMKDHLFGAVVRAAVNTGLFAGSDSTPPPTPKAQAASVSDLQPKDLFCGLRIVQLTRADVSFEFDGRPYFLPRGIVQHMLNNHAPVVKSDNPLKIEFVRHELGTHIVVDGAESPSFSDLEGRCFVEVPKP